MDGHVSRDNYGVLVIQSPTTPPGDNNIHMQTVAPTSVSGVIIRESEGIVKGQGHSYKSHLSRLHAIKSNYIYIRSCSYWIVTIAPLSLPSST